jgi:hypothetical protein
VASVWFPCVFLLFCFASDVPNPVGNFADLSWKGFIPQALAYISQLLLNSFPASERAAEAEKKAAEEKETARINRINALIRQQARERAARRLQQSTNSTVVVRTDGQMTVSPSKDSAGGQA